MLDIMPSLTDMKTFVSQLSSKQLDELVKKLQRKKKRQSGAFRPAAARSVAPKAAPAPQSSALERVSPVKQTRRDIFMEYADHFKIPLKARGRVPLSELKKKDPKAAEAYTRGEALDTFLKGQDLLSTVTEEELLAELPEVPTTPKAYPKMSLVQLAREKAKERKTMPVAEGPLDRAWAAVGKARENKVENLEAAFADETTGGYTRFVYP